LAGELSPAPRQNYFSPIQPVPGYKFSEVELNWYTNCGIKLGGAVLCWGNNYGLGYPWNTPDTPAPISPRTDGSFAELSSGGRTFFGRTRDGRGVRWGASAGGGTLNPTELTLGVRAIELSGGGYGYCIIAESGALYCDHSWDASAGLKAIPAASIP
jgi:hypothetical protein